MRSRGAGRSRGTLLLAGLVVSLVVSAVLAGCGTSPPDVTASASRILTADVLRLQSVARSGTDAQVASAGDQLRADVATLRSDGQLSAARAEAILDQLARVLADRAATPRPSPTPSPTRSSPPSEKPDRGKGKGNSEGKGD